MLSLANLQREGMWAVYIYTTPTMKAIHGLQQRHESRLLKPTPNSYHE